MSYTEIDARYDILSRARVPKIKNILLPGSAREQLDYFGGWWPKDSAGLQGVWIRDESIAILGARTLDALNAGLESARCAIEEMCFEAEEHIVRDGMRDLDLPQGAIDFLRRRESPRHHEAFLDSAEFRTEDLEIEQVLAALAIWHVGEFRSLQEESEEDALWNLIEAACCLGAAREFVGRQETARMIREHDKWRNHVRAKRAADHAHASNRERRSQARRFWQEGSWRKQADAIRAIAEKFSVEVKTAERWVLLWKKMA